MGFSQHSDEIRALFVPGFATAQPSVPINYVNVRGTVVGSIPTPSAPWIKFSIRERRSRMVSFGNPGSRNIVRGGAVVVEVFVPIGDGEKVLRTIADSVASVLELRATAHVQLEESRLTLVGQEGSFYKGIVYTTFRADDFV